MQESLISQPLKRMNLLHRISHEQYVAIQRDKIASLAKAILHGERGIVDASREIVHLQHEAEADNDEDFTIFHVIDSETDHLPTGSERENWNAEILKEKEREIAEYEAFYINEAVTACKNIICKFGSQ